MNDPLNSHLMDIISDPASTGLILAGGYGIQLKQAHLKEMGERTVIASIPESRATQDIDFFLSLSFFLSSEKGKAVRQLLDRLEYTVVLNSENHRFEKRHKLEKQMNNDVIVDFLARQPLLSEAVKSDSFRVGKNSGANLHGRTTVEAFAVEDSPVKLTVKTIGVNDGLAIAEVLVPHPYAWINLKVRAAHDWLLRERGEKPPKANSRKHVLMYIF